MQTIDMRTNEIQNVNLLTISSKLLWIFVVVVVVEAGVDFIRYVIHTSSAFWCHAANLARFVCYKKEKKNNILKLNRIYLNCAFERDKHFFMNWSVIAIDSSMNKFSNACHSHFLHGHNQCIPKKCKTWSDNQMHTISLFYGHFQTYGEKKI